MRNSRRSTLRNSVGITFSRTALSNLHVVRIPAALLAALRGRVKPALPAAETLRQHGRDVRISLSTGLNEGYKNMFLNDNAKIYRFVRFAFCVCLRSNHS
jgi:hypothetical protein